jgi:hypothetical protein
MYDAGNSAVDDLDGFCCELLVYVSVEDGTFACCAADIETVSTLCDEVFDELFKNFAIACS